MNDLTNAEKYTPQFGFSPGVVVEIISTTNYFTFGKFIGLDRRYMELYKQQEERITVDSCGYVDIPIREIKSLRLLSGPFAIWQFAPEWAEGCYLDDTNLPVIFYGPESRIPWADAKKMYGTEGMMDRPWWCQKKETKNAKSEAI